MAWKLRQFFEGDTVVTASGVTSVGTECWISGGNYATNTIAVKVDGVEHLIPSSDATLSNGYFAAKIPSGTLIGPVSTVQIYAVCEDLPASKTPTLTAKPVNFQIFNDTIKACNPTVIINSDLNEYIRFYLTPNSGTFFNAKINNADLSISNFSYQTGDTGNITSASGNFSRPTTDTDGASIISNVIYAGSNTLTITPASTSLYFTARLGYIELIFDGGNMKYINYTVSSEVEVAAGTYTVGDVITIESTRPLYTIRKNGVVVFTKNKNISYTVSAGTISPSSSQIGIPVVWNLPSTPGTYTFGATVGDSLKFSRSIILHSCADAVDDFFTGTYNTAYIGNVSTNDVKCTGENNYYELVGTPPYVNSGSIVLNQSSGLFTYTPVLNFNSTAIFYYNIRCGSSFGTSELIDTAKVEVNYYSLCNGVTANWQPNGQIRCTNCTEERQEIDTNSQCTGNAPRWVANPGGSACNVLPTLTPTGLVRCDSCIEQREVQDLNTCSPTYLNKSWVENPNGTQCNRVPVWQDNGITRCQNCIEQKQQRDTATCSSTYNTTRWIDNPGGTQCNRTPVWTDTNQFTCESCVEKKQQKDTNPCSPSFNLFRTIDNPTGEVCNTEPVWVNTGLTRCYNGVHQFEQISSNPCSIEQQRWIEDGSICGCTPQIAFNNKCEDGTENVVVGVDVKRENTYEDNRVISFANNVITFGADIGTFTYIVTIIYESGLKPTIIKYKNYTCNPTLN